MVDSCCREPAKPVKQVSPCSVVVFHVLRVPQTKRSVFEASEERFLDPEVGHGIGEPLEEPGGGFRRSAIGIGGDQEYTDGPARTLGGGVEGETD